MVTCPNCNSQQPDGAAFCDECGAQLESPSPAAQAQPTPQSGGSQCPTCGAPVTPGEAFCDNCGEALNAPSASPQQTPYSSPPSGQAGSLTCPQCGAQLEPGSNFCDMCGASVGGGQQDPGQQSPYPTPSTESPPHQPPKTKQVPSGHPSHPVPDPGSQPTPSHPPEPTPPPTSPGRFVVQSTNKPLPFPPGKTQFTIGREDPVSNIFPDIDLTDYGGDESGVSREHARVTIQGGQILIEDLDSLNYTHVNQQRLTPGQPHPLNDGDEVQLGKLKLTFHTS